MTPRGVIMKLNRKQPIGRHGGSDLSDITLYVLKHVGPKFTPFNNFPEARLAALRYPRSNRLDCGSQDSFRRRSR